jgi:hypothetical protein
MNAMQAPTRSQARTGGQYSTGPKPGSGKRDSVSETPVDAQYVARQNAMLAAMIQNTQPGDLEYARKMARVYELAHEAASLHARMVECYEDGLTKQAAKFARAAAECGYEMSDLHAELAQVFDTLVPFEGTHFSAVHMHDRYPSNMSQAARDKLGPDTFIDEVKNG